MFRENSKITNTQEESPAMVEGLLIWGTAVLFTIFQLFLEMLSNTMANSLMISFNINHVGVGILSSAFFYSFLTMQIPAGLILDKFNVKWVLSIACALCGIGCLLFGHSTNFTYAIFSRLIMGGFAAFGFLGLLKISATFYPLKMFPFLVGFSQFLVMIATAFGEPIIAHYLNYYSWRTILNYMGYLSFTIAILICIFVKQRNKITLITEKIKVEYKLKTVLFNKQYWLASIYGFGMFSVIASFSALWGFNYLIEVYYLNNHQAAIGISMNFAGVAFGCVLFGILASFFKNYRILMSCSSLSALLLISVLFFSPTVTIMQIYIILFLLGLFCGIFFLCFDIIKKVTPANSGGIAIAFCNIVVMSSTIILQPIMGFLIDYSGSYQFSTIVLVCAITTAFIISFFLRIEENTITKEKMLLSSIISPP